MQLECELTDFIGKAPDQALALEQDIEPHVAQAGLLPQHIGMRQWLLQRPAIFDVDGQRVSLTRQSVEYDRHLETQFVALLQRLGRPAHMSKDMVAYCKKNNIDMRVSLPLDLLSFAFSSPCMLASLPLPPRLPMLYCKVDHVNPSVALSCACCISELMSATANAKPILT